MAWNWLCGNNTTPFSLSEFTGDSEEVKSDVHHDHEEDEAATDDPEGVLFRFNDENEVVVVVVVEDDDDDAHSCSHDHSSFSNTRYGSDCNNRNDQPQRLIYDDDDGDINDDDDDNNKKNQYETKVMDSSEQQWGSIKSCVDPLNQTEINRKFWEACLAS